MKSLLVIITLAAVLGAGSSSAVEVPAQGASAMVVTAHPLATHVGLSILRLGGNAFDAAIAVALALAVVEPYSSGIGGGGFLVTFDGESGQSRCLDARETAPLKSHRDMYLVDGQPDPQLSRFSPLAVAVPGLIAGLWELHREEGSLSWPTLVEPATSLAADGFPVSTLLHDRIAEFSYRFNEAARAIFLPGGMALEVGDLLVQTDLARTLAGVSERGPQAFYRGPVAQSIVETATHGELGLTLEDLTSFQPTWRDPILGHYRGLKIVSMPPPSSGGVHLVQMLDMVEKFDLQASGSGSATSFHILTEAMKFAYADRSLYLGDSDFVPVPLDMLNSQARTDSLVQLVDLDHAYPEKEIKGAPLLDLESSETTHFSIVDERGHAVAATLTINLSFGSGLVAPGTGVLLNDEMDDFVAAPGQVNAFGLVGGEANSIAPGKRPLSSMTPTLVLQDDKVRMVTGAPGGSKIISTTLQTIVNVVDFEMNALQAVSAPRIHHQWYPRVLYFEHFGMSPDTQDLLRAKGHQLESRSPMCNAQVIVVDPETQVRFGASDPRGMGLAAGY